MLDLGGGPVVGGLVALGMGKGRKSAIPFGPYLAAGAVVGALTIGVAEELSLLSLAPAYRTAVGFVAILVVLTLRPRGILGERAF